MALSLLPFIPSVSAGTADTAPQSRRDLSHRQVAHLPHLPPLRSISNLSFSRSFTFSFFELPLHHSPRCRAERVRNLLLLWRQINFWKIKDRFIKILQFVLFWQINSCLATSYPISKKYSKLSLGEEQDKYFITIIKTTYKLPINTLIIRKECRRSLKKLKTQN